MQSAHGIETHQHPVLTIRNGVKWKGGTDNVMGRTGVKEREILTYCSEDPNGVHC